jgi:hypothetical protein
MQERPVMSITVSVPDTTRDALKHATLVVGKVLLWRDYLPLPRSRGDEPPTFLLPAG